jgi:ribosomal protein S18 acetylase RimI-like enzyme
MTPTYRDATPDDAELVLAMLLHAANWSPRRRPLTREQVVGDPKLAHYAAGWPRPSDLGVVVQDTDGVGVGAAWLRCFTEDDPSYGFVAADIPELSIGVSPAWRGQGLGTRLCNRLLAHAEARGIRQVSLSVEKANPARALYERLGFVTVRDDGDAVTTLRRSPSPTSASTGADLSRHSSAEEQQ